MVMTLALRIAIFLAAHLLLVISAAQIASAGPKRTANNPYECWVEGEDGRKRPCQAGYRRRSDRNQYDCVTEDGYGRRLPCAARFKR
jgi:hypothetical protein